MNGEKDETNTAVVLVFYFYKIFIAIAICAFLVGCGRMTIKDGELYLNQNTSVGIEDLGVAKVRNQFGE